MTRVIPEEYADQRVGLSGYRVLGLDLDGVCSDYVRGLRDFVCRERAIDPASIPDPDAYNLAEASGWPFSDTADYLRTHRAAVQDGLYRSMPALPGVSDALKALDAAHVYIRIVTHRLFFGGMHRRIVTDTATWLDANELPYMSLCFAGLKDSIGATVHIEDSPSTISLLRETGQTVFVYDQPYNRGVKGLRITSWQHAVPLILDAFDAAGHPAQG